MTKRQLLVALQKAYPEQFFIKLKKKVSASEYWRDPQNCRTFFEVFATMKGFDPLRPENWRSTDLEQMTKLMVGSPLPLCFLLYVFSNKMLISYREEKTCGCSMGALKQLLRWHFPRYYGADICGKVFERLFR